MALLLHANAVSVSREDLRGVETPGRTETWTPVGHYELATGVIERSERAGFQVVREMYGLTPNGARMFGVIDLKHQINDEMSFAIGLRNSHNKTLKAGLCAGARVFVCDNLVFSGEMANFSRKHSRHFSLGELIERAFDQLPFTFQNLCDQVKELKKVECSEEDAKLFIFEAALRGFICPSEMVNVYHEFISPTHPEFQGFNRHNLLMAFTEKAKDHPPGKAIRSYNGIARLFGL